MDFVLLNKKVRLKIKLDCIYKDLHWKRYSTGFLKKIIRTTFLNTDLGLFNVSWEMSIIFTNGEEVKNLNKKYRNIDKDTNILSFQYVDWGKKLVKKEFLGDIIFSYDKIIEESKHAGKTFDSHFTHLLVHGLLHLLGYDHIVESDAELMENLEIKILEELGIQSPYERK